MMAMRLAELMAPPALTRLATLAPLDSDATAALGVALQRVRRHRARREFLAEGEEIAEPMLLLDGWAARTRLLEDGRRQILHFLLPGDVIGRHDHERPLATSAVYAVTDVEACVAPRPDASPALARAYALARAHEEAQFLAQITRLGRFDAHERIVDLFLELLERLEVAGMAVAGRYTLPLTQEMIADTLGLTSVHVNRTLQTLRRSGDVVWKGRDLVLPSPAELRRRVGRHPVRVSGS